MADAPPSPIYQGSISGHDVALIADGGLRLARMVSAIEAARTSLQMFFYIYADDATGRRIRALLIDACNRGVKVTLLVDGFGSQALPVAFFDDLRNAGARIDWFLPRFGRRYLLRNHQKMIVADKRRALIGGANIADTYFTEAPPEKQWHDLMLDITGDAVERLAHYFEALDLWVEGDRGLRALQRILVTHTDHHDAIRWVMGGPFQRLSPLARMLRTDLDRARRIDMIQAYFAPDPSFLRRLGRAARGGTVRVITAAKSDNITTIAAARHCYTALLKRGAHIYEYLAARLHMKLIVADDLVYVGSANFDARSLFINVELMLRIEDKGLARAMREYCTAQQAFSQRVDQKWLKRVSGPFRRLRWLFAYFLVTTVDYTITRRINIGPDRRRWLPVENGSQPPRQ